MAICKLLMSSLFRLHVLANTEDNSDTGDIELIRHLHVNVSSLKILLQGTTFAIIVIIIIIFIIVFFFKRLKPIHNFNLCWKPVWFHDMKTIQSSHKCTS